VLFRNQTASAWYVFNFCGMSALLCLTKSRAESKGWGVVRNSSYVAVRGEELSVRAWHVILRSSSRSTFFSANCRVKERLREIARDLCRLIHAEGLGDVEHRAPGDCGMHLQEEAVNWIRLRAQTHMITMLLLFFILLFYSVTLNRK